MNPPFYSQIQYLIIAAIFLSIIGSIFRTRYAVVGYLLIILFRPGELFQFLGTIRFELFIVIFLVTLILLKGRIDRFKPRCHRIVMAAFVFFGLSLLSIVQSLDISASYEYAYSELFPVIILFSLIVTMIDDYRDTKFLLLTYIGAVAYLAYLPIFNHLHGIGSELIGAHIMRSKGQTSGVAGHVAMANLMTQTIPFAFFLFLREKKILKKFIFITFMSVFVTATIFSGSRGGFLGLIICGALIIYKSKKRTLTLIIGLVFIISASGMMSEKYFSWMSTILNPTQEYSADSRIEGLRHGIEMAFRRPILGVGIGCFAIARSDWFGWNIWAHNLYGELIGELGVLGTIAWFRLIFLCFKEIKRINDFLILSKNVNEIYQTIIDCCWTILVLRLIIGMTTHCLMSYIWYMIAGILVVTSNSLEKEYPDFAYVVEVKKSESVLKAVGSVEHGSD